MKVARVIPCLDVTDGRVVKGTNFVDLRDAAGTFMTLDYGGDPEQREPALYVGASVSLPALELRPLREFEGWRA